MSKWKCYSLAEKITVVDKETIEVEKSGKKDRARTREKTLQGNEGKACSGFHEYYQSFFFFLELRAPLK